MKNQKKLFLSGVLTVGCTLLLLLWKTAEEAKKNDRPFAQEEAQINVIENTDDTDNIGCVRKKPETPYTLAYCEFLKEYVKDTPYPYIEGKYARFGLVFLDDNDIPELLLMEDDCHAAGVKVYTYVQGMVKEVGSFGSFGKMQYVEREGKIFSHYMGQGEQVSCFFELEEGEARQVGYLHSWTDYSHEEFCNLYEIDGTPVSEEKYQEKWEELYEAQEYILIGYEDGIPVREDDLMSSMAEAVENLTWGRGSDWLAEQVSAQPKILKVYTEFLQNYAQEPGKAERAASLPGRMPE